MKLLMLLVALLVRTYPSLSAPTLNPSINVPFDEVLDNLHQIQQELAGLTPKELKQNLAVFNQTVKIQTPRNIKNACECEAKFVQQLKKALTLIGEVFPFDQIFNILDMLHAVHLPKNPSNNCNFTTHRIRDASLINFTRDNIDFIENWNSKCMRKN